MNLGNPRAANCPRCGATMILRTAKKGPHRGNQFYGCSKYPLCKGTRDAPKNQTEDTAKAAEESKLASKITETGTPLSDVQKKELLRLRDRLFDLSSRNRSIKLNKLDVKWAFDLHKLNAFGDSYP